MWYLIPIELAKIFFVWAYLELAYGSEYDGSMWACDRSKECYE